MQVQNAVLLSVLIQRLQEERAAVALNIFINKTYIGGSTLDSSLDDLQKYVETDGIDISQFGLRNVSMDFHYI